MRLVLLLFMSTHEMKIYALIDRCVVVEIILPFFNNEGEYVPIDQRYTPQMVAQMVDITNLNPQPECFWTYDGSVFAAPVPYQLPPEEIEAANQAQRAALLAQASQAMAPLFMSLQLGDATDEETIKAKAWQAYYRALQTVDVTVSEPAWPQLPA
ncbi:tail fiber assembly protein [Pseudomonas sp. MAG733B]|uniref:tail fiber assembly protein n=1 Tax=Pseudomonas sp. MAG733B TaxID=3122079 RepID=UPI0030CBD4BE